MLIDDVTITVKAGRGGNGVVRFAKTMMMLGPTGGNGGNGGNIIVRGVPDLGALRVFRTRKDVKAKNGVDGGQNIQDGARGANAVINVPVGSVIKDCKSGVTYEITQTGQEEVVARGGTGGFGNFHFRSSRHTSPDRANDGVPGYETQLHIQLKMIADVGFVGLPNVGKSSLLNALTNASSKVANYRFTTLDPHLGVYYKLILADIPGLIAGAADGKGLGHKFLRHIERTRVLFHFVAADSEDPVADYRTIRAELGAYNKKLLTKPEWVIVSRADERTPQEVETIVAQLAKENPHCVALSLLDDASVAHLRDDVLSQIIPQ